MLSELRKDIAALTKSEKTLFCIAAVITLIGTFFMYWLFNYIDGQSIMVWSVNNWDLLVEGRWQDFYTDKALNLRGAMHNDMSAEGLISPFMYILQSIWCLPIWLTHYFNGNLYIGTIGCVYYYKVLLFILTVVMAYYCYKMAKELSGSGYKSLMAGLLVLGSSEILLSTGYSGQDEIVYLCATVMALDALIHSRMKLFVGLSTFVVTLCPLMIVPMFAMLLLRQKNLFRVILDAVIMFVPSGFWTLVSAGMEGKYTANTMNEQFEWIIDYIGIPVANGSASLMVLVSLAVFVICFYLDSNISSRQIVWFSSLLPIYLSFFTNSLFYRSLLFVPFVCILITLCEGKSYDLAVLMMAILNYVRFFTLGIKSPMHMNTLYTGGNKAVVAFCQRFGSTKYETYDPLVDKIIEKAPTLGDLGSSLNAVNVLAILILLWMTFSDKNSKKLESRTLISEKISFFAYMVCIPVYLMIFFVLLIK